MLTAEKLGSSLAKEAAVGEIFPQIGEGILKAVRALGGRNLGRKMYAQMANPKDYVAALNRVSGLRQGLEGARAAGVGADTLGHMEHRMGRAKMLADVARRRQLERIGAMGTGLGLGTASVLTSGDDRQQQPPPMGMPRY